MDKRDYDAVVVGSGPNGLAAAILMQQHGLSVLLLEAKSTIGGGLRTAQLTLPGYLHDVCSAIHPLAAASPFFSRLPLAQHGLQYVLPTLHAAHPFTDGTAAILSSSIAQTAASLGADGQAYQKLLEPLARNWGKLIPDILGPLKIPAHPMVMAGFGLNALGSATHLAKKFTTETAKGFWAGMAAHSLQPLTNLTTSAVGLVLLAAGHAGGWPIPVGGSQNIANALASYFVALGGHIETGIHIQSMVQLPSAHAVLFDVGPRQLLQIAGNELSSFYKWQMGRFRYGMGVYKIDWALDGPIPFTAPDCRKAGTVHLGGTLAEIVHGEHETSLGRHAEKPFVLLAQQSLFDASRAPAGKQVAWGYCHVPHGSTQNMTDIIERQVERFAPGFRDRILARHTMNTAEMQAYNPNYIGGDINGGVLDISQLYTRPALRFSPYHTSAKGLYICSSSTPPGGGVHGMCGYYAAKRALKDVFNQRTEDR